VSIHARSTICHGCNAAIDLTDLEFLSESSRPVDTRGHLHVGAEGKVNSLWIICGSARIEGRVSGVLRSEGEVVLATQGSMVCEISAPAVLIEKAARVQLTMPIETDSLIVRGQLSGVVRCRGPVRVLRGGLLAADVRARSVIVERGGELIGDLRVDNLQPREPGRSRHDRRVRRPFSPLSGIQAGALS
jgi:cytoskeletal protein CcmA (bactofilin family)